MHYQRVFVLSTIDELNSVNGRYGNHFVQNLYYVNYAPNSLIIRQLRCRRNVNNNML